MSDVIHLLPDSVANQIAAGEVIQRPASVVKELAENAVDAGSTSVTVIVRDGGKTSIQVIDNGCGMSGTDARMSFERHATSKIREARDLFAIRTLGFRGEALASIASIAQVTLVTRKSDAELGTSISISGSKFEGQDPVNSNPGTNFTVKNLFFNVPARRKFLKTNNAELKHIIYEFQRIALANPDVEFHLESNDAEIYHLPASNTKQRIVHLFGKAMNQSLASIETETSLVRITGFLGKPEYARRTPGEQFFFINGRYMKHPYFHKAVMSAYEKILPPDTLPSYFIYLDADPDTIDINIHPTKTEIKFENEPAIFQILLAAARETLGKSNIFPTIDFDAEKAIEFPVGRRSDPIRVPEISYNHNYNPFDEELKYRAGADHDNLSHWESLFPSDPVRHAPAPPAEEQTEQQQLSFGSQSHTDTFVQLKNRYILTPVKSGLMVIDQHRAHERILYERFIRSLAMNYPLAQHTLFPETVELDHADYLILLEIMDDLHTIGFDIRDFGNNSVVVGGYPVEHTGSARDLIDNFLEEYKNTEGDLKTGARERIARSLAAAGAISSGEVLSPTAMQDLVDNLFACESPGYSPSGKLVISIIGMEELDRRFK